MVSIQRATVWSWSLSSEHTAQHGQSLNVTHVTVVIQAGGLTHKHATFSSGSERLVQSAKHYIFSILLKRPLQDSFSLFLSL